MAFFSAVQAGQGTLNKHTLSARGGRERGGGTRAGPFSANKQNPRRGDSSRPTCSWYSRLEEVIRGAVDMYIHASIYYRPALCFTRQSKNRVTLPRHANRWQHAIIQPGRIFARVGLVFLTDFTQFSQFSQHRQDYWYDLTNAVENHAFAFELLCAVRMLFIYPMLMTVL